MLWPEHTVTQELLAEAGIDSNAIQAAIAARWA